MKVRNRIILATPFICAFAFFLVGFITNVWSPTWCIFLLIPIMPIILSESWVRDLVPVIFIILFIIGGIVFKDFSKSWIVLLLIPAYYILVGPKFGRIKSKRVKNNRFEYRENL